MGTGVVGGESYLAHEPGAGHPERPERVQALLGLLDEFARIEPRAATHDELGAVHTPEHIDRVAASAGVAAVRFDPDTTSSPRSYETALLAAGGFLALLDAVMAGDVTSGFALVRPPGHHAEASRAMGFCLFNNVAVGARHLQRHHGLDRIMIVDWDVHHGNGTQHAFEADPEVLYVSLHQYPFYPGTGAASEVGIRDGAGRTLNVPLPGGCGDDVYATAFRRIVDPVARTFDPEFVLVSAGFDAHARDPLGAMRLTEQAFRDMTRLLLAVARDHGSGRCAMVLEGGYDLDSLRECVAAVLDEMETPRDPEPRAVSARAEALLEPVREAQRPFWRLG